MCLSHSSDNIHIDMPWGSWDSFYFQACELCMHCREAPWGKILYPCDFQVSCSTSSQGVSAQGSISGYWAGSRVPGGSARTLLPRGGRAIPLGWAPAPQNSLKSSAFAQKVVSGNRYLEFKRWLGCHADIVSIKILGLISTLFLSPGNYSWVFHTDEIDKQTKTLIMVEVPGNPHTNMMRNEAKAEPNLLARLEETHVVVSRSGCVFPQWAESAPGGWSEHGRPWSSSTDNHLQDGSLLGSVISCTHSPKLP